MTIFLVSVFPSLLIAYGIMKVAEDIKNKSNEKASLGQKITLFIVVIFLIGILFMLSHAVSLVLEIAKDAENF